MSRLLDRAIRELREETAAEADDAITRQRIEAEWLVRKARARIIRRATTVAALALIMGGGALAAVFVAAQKAQDRGGIGFFALGGNLREDFFDRAQLLRLIVDDEIGFVAQLLNVLAQDAHAERMKRANRRPGFLHA